MEKSSQNGFPVVSNLRTDGDLSTRKRSANHRHKKSRMPNVGVRSNGLVEQPQDGSPIKANGTRISSEQPRRKNKLRSTLTFLPRELVPECMWEPGILTGYRPTHQAWTYYIKSLFWIHNETGNIWTHLLSPVISVAMIYHFSTTIDFKSNYSAHGLLMYAVASCCLYLLSTTAHLLHNQSLTAHFVVFCFDFAGIAIIGYGTGTMLYYCSGTQLFYTTIGSWFPWLQALCSTSITLGNSYVRKFCVRGGKASKFVLCGTSVINFLCSQIPIFFRLYECSTQDTCFHSPNFYHVLPWIFSVVNVLLFTLHLPERAYPGKFDIWGHGHQWMHVSVTCDVSAFLYASYVDVVTLPQDVLKLAQPSIFTIWMSFVIVVLVNLFIVLVISLMQKTVERNRK